MQKKTKRKRTPRIIRVAKNIFILLFLLVLWNGFSSREGLAVFHHTPTSEKPMLEEALLTVNPYSRPGKTLSAVNGVVIHYVANPGSTAMANRNYFDNLATTHTTYASSHFVIDIDGTIVQCIPLNEVAYASNGRNNDTISIEVCHPDSSGKFSNASYDSLVSLVSWLSGKYNLKQDQIIRHYDVTGKLCPKYYVEHEDAWEKLKEDIFS